MNRLNNFTCAALLLMSVEVFAQPGTGGVAVAPKKFALLIGIDAYQNDLPPLEGCAKDAKNMAELLAKTYKFLPQNLQTLTDKAANRQSILNALRLHEAKSQKGDLFVFYYSGHGSLFPDAKSEERDETKIITPPDENLKRGKYDSALCPVDTGSSRHSGKPWRNLILDDELYAQFSRFTQKGCAVIFIADSCNSGTIGKGVMKVINKSLNLEDALKIKFDEISAPEIAREIKPPNMRGQYLILSSSQDSQFSGATSNGSLFTSALIETLRLAPQRNYNDLYKVVKKKVLKDSENTQEPQLDKRFFQGSLESTFLSFLETVHTTSDSVAVPLNVRLMVTDYRDQPIKDVTVSLVSDGIGYTNKTSAKGVCLLRNINPKAYKISIRHQSYKPIEANLEITESPLNPGQADLVVLLKPR